MATRQIDFSNAFVQAKLDEDVYIEVPKGYTMGNNGKLVLDSSPGREEFVLKLDRSLYGLVQAPMYWGRHLKAALERHCFKPSIYDACCYTNDQGMVILTYCDDCLFFHHSQDEIDKVIDKLRADKLSLTVEEDIFSFLGVQVAKEDGELELLQTGLIDKVLRTCKMQDCNVKDTPAMPTPLGTDSNGPRWDAEWDYSSVVGMLMYLCSNSRPDIQFAVHQCARFTHCPRKSHEKAIVRICRYLKGTRFKGLRLKPNKTMKLDCYVDADFAGLWNVENVQDPVCVKSRTGFCLTLGDCPLLWTSKLQTEVSLSTTEAEYIALSQAMRELIPMRSFLLEIGKRVKLEFAQGTMLHSTVFEDNNGALSLATAPKITPRTKHIAVKYHHFRESVGEDKGIRIVKVDTKEQKADIFTKGLTGETYKTIRKLLMGW
jgi:histone deacetylase 1/2